MIDYLQWLYPKMVEPELTDIIIFILIILLGWILQHYVLKYLIKRTARFFEKRSKIVTARILEHFSRETRHAIFTGIIFFALSWLIEISLFSNPSVRNFFYSLMVFYAFKGMYDVLTYYANHPETFYLKEKKVPFLTPFSLRIIKAFLALVAIAIIAGLWHFNLNGFLTGIGLTGVALAFGIRDTSAHIFGGLSMGFDRPFQVGDFITTEDGKVEGTILDINLRSTLISTADKGIVYVPNAYLMNKPIYNLSKREKRKIETFLYVSTNQNEESIRNICSEINKQILLHPKTSKEDFILVYIDEFHADYYRMLISFFVPTNNIHEKYAVQQDIIFVTKQILDEGAIQLIDPNALKNNNV
ncbi:MscS family membrane protein [Ureibacillus xyleni]|uniref:MscS family membrane protein n=1 Tax=Ureibacillus xyleni TaxID=614648 RepID=A0A285RXB3_9BACL|nr:mechanosensitive ion channel family protein [Ureibacillus xyleni]SOB98815.1 MscS family membrane protein [Ureibacillus xyleni]